MDEEIEAGISAVDGDEIAPEVNADYTPIFKMYADTRIPVSKELGKFWEARQTAGQQLLKSSGAQDRWEEAIAYYQNDQAGKTSKRRRLNEVAKGSESETSNLYSTENVVFANVSALVPATYAKNPDINITCEKNNEPQARMFERLIDTLFRRKVAPGMNIKPKMRRALITTMLTNISYLELSYTKKEDGSEYALQEIERISESMKDAKDTNELQKLEGELMALMDKINLLSSSGPKLRVRQPHMVILDPDAEETDLTDHSYIIIGELVRTSFLNAVYAEKNEQGDYVSLYEPTHVLKANVNNDEGHEDLINNFRLLNETGNEHAKYGYDNKRDFDEACRTLVWNVWDKTTRRVYMFSDKDWSWPIWVWDDPYKLTRFFPIFPVQFYTDPSDMYGRSEVMYYLDQQDEINRMNNERSRMRHWVMSKVFYDTNVFKDQTAVKRFLSSSTSDFVYGIDMPEGRTLQNAIGTLAPPSAQFEQLFDTRPIFESINRLSSVTPILQSVQFKTNTTNKAIESYESSTQTRLDEKIDAIEECLGDIGTALLEMCVQFMDETDVINLVGTEVVEGAGGWVQDIIPDSLHVDYSLHIVGGSTLKPTSKVKKEQAVHLGQVLGQFANASPAVVMVMLKMISRAFSEDVVITDEDWAMILESTQQMLQQGSPQGDGPPQQQGGPSPQQGGPDPAQLMQMMDQLPPEAKQMIAQEFTQGRPLGEIIEAVMAQMQGAPQ